jgi:hypothetical protein
MAWRRRRLATAAFAGALAVCALARPAAAVQVLPVPLNLGDAEFDAVWWLPPGPPVGLASVQHGFARRCNHLAGTLAALARGGFIVLCLDAEMARGNPPLAMVLATALRDGLAPPGHDAATLPIVVSGHSAGAVFASHLGAALVQAAPERLAGALLFDPVPGDGLAARLMAISDQGARPVRAISAAAGGCNLQGQADTALAEVHDAAGAAGRPGFVGVRLAEASTHLDAEGEDSSALAAWACGQGPPRPANVELLRALAVAWALEMLQPGRAAEGEALERALADGRAVPIR